MAEGSFFIRQSPVTDPGRIASALDTLPGDVAGLRHVSQQLVFHYRAGGDWEAAGVAADRIGEVDTRYAEAMFGRLFELAPSLTAERRPAERIVGCCRDFTVLFVAMARHKNIPARARVGFATYFERGWFVDHVIAEVWDHGQDRWRLIEPEIPDGFAPADGAEFDPVDVPRDRFLTGPKAWLEARAGVREAERFVVSPNLDIPHTRGWSYLRHNLVHDLVALDKIEMLLWDGWGEMDGPPLQISNATHTQRYLETLDHIARLTADPACPVQNIEDLARRDGLAVPAIVTSYTPAADEPVQVDVSRAIA